MATHASAVRFFSPCSPARLLPPRGLWLWLRGQARRLRPRRSPSSPKAGPAPVSQQQGIQLEHPGIVKALAALPDDTVIDGELVALDKHGRLRRWSRDLKCGLGADT